MQPNSNSCTADCSVLKLANSTVIKRISDSAFAELHTEKEEYIKGYFKGIGKQLEKNDRDMKKLSKLRNDIYVMIGILENMSIQQVSDYLRVTEGYDFDYCIEYLKKNHTPSPANCSVGLGNISSPPSAI